MTKTDGAEFVAIITPKDGTHYLECFLRQPPEAPGFPSEMIPVYENSTLPAFPPLPRETARKIAIEMAHQHGFTPEEITWENP